MFQFPAFALFPLFIRVRVTIAGWVSPFGYPRITAYSQLPTAFRSVSRPSSPLIAKASTKCSYHSLDSSSCINNLSFIHSSILSKIYQYYKYRYIILFSFDYSFLLSYSLYFITITFAISTLQTLVEVRRFELLTPCLQSRCSPS